MFWQGEEQPEAAELDLEPGQLADDRQAADHAQVQHRPCTCLPGRRRADAALCHEAAALLSSVRCSLPVSQDAGLQAGWQGRSQPRGSSRPRCSHTVRSSTVLGALSLKPHVLLLLGLHDSSGNLRRHMATMPMANL